MFFVLARKKAKTKTTMLTEKQKKKKKKKQKQKKAVAAEVRFDTLKDKRPLPWVAESRRPQRHRRKVVDGGDAG